MIPHRMTNVDIYIYATGAFYQTTDSPSINLKAEIKSAFGKNIRRIDRFIQMSLIAAQRCTRSLDLPATTGVYLASAYGPVSNTEEVLHQIYRLKERPKPFTFVNSVSNAANFIIAKTLGFESVSQFIASGYTSFESTLRIALLDLSLNAVPLALIGSTDECPQPVETQRKRMGVSESRVLGEGSSWFVIGKQHQNLTPLAKIAMLERTDALKEAIEKIKGLIDLPRSSVAVAPWLSADEIAEIGQFFEGCDISDAESLYGYTPSLLGTIASQFVNQSDSKQFLIHISKDPQGFFELMVISKEI